MSVNVFDLSETLGILSDTPFEETKLILKQLISPHKEMSSMKCSFSARRRSTQTNNFASVCRSKASSAVQNVTATHVHRVMNIQLRRAFIMFRMANTKL